MKYIIKLIILFSLFSLPEAITQSEQLEVEGAIIISDSKSLAPVEGTIRWTGTDFEGWNGTEWLSLTCCTSPCFLEMDCPAGVQTVIDQNNFCTF